LTMLDEPCLPTPNMSFPHDGKSLEHLTITSGLRPVVCPHFVSLHLDEFYVASDETLLQFVLSRTGPHGHLSRVVASFERARDFDIMPHLQDVVAGRLFISLDYGSEPADEYSRIICLCGEGSIRTFKFGRLKTLDQQNTCITLDILRMLILTPPAIILLD